MSADQGFVPPHPTVTPEDLNRFKDVAHVFMNEFTNALKDRAAPAITAGMVAQLGQHGPAILNQVVDSLGKAVGAGILIGLSAQYQVEAFDPETGRTGMKVVTGAQLLRDLYESNLELAASMQDGEDEEEEPEPVRPRRRGR